MKRGTRNAELGATPLFSFSKKAARACSPFRVSRSAFTLMEVLIVIALLGVVTAVVTVDFDSLLGNAATPSAYDRLSESVEAGRTGALGAGQSLRLVWVPDARALRLIGSGEPRDFPLPGAESVTFAFPDDGAGGERPLEELTFHPSGVCMPAYIDLVVSGSRTRYRLEMFSAALSPEGPR